MKPLEERRAAIKLNIFFKAQQGLVEIPIDHLKCDRVSARRAGSYSIPHSSVDSHKFSFYPNTIRLWNDLPTECKQARCAVSFKNYIDKTTLRAAY